MTLPWCFLAEMDVLVMSALSVSRGASGSEHNVAAEFPVQRLIPVVLQ